MVLIQIVPLLEDNYAYLLSHNGVNAIVDPGEAAPVIQVLEGQGLKLDYILNTHHHWDHTDGNAELKRVYGAQIVGPAAEAHRIEGLDIGLKEGDVFDLGGEKAQVLETPGHTTGHIVFWLPDSQALFCGDVLFSMSCGRLFEGTPSDMWGSFQKILGLPDDTMIYCGHEYTEENGEFGLKIEPDNPDLHTRMNEVRTLRKAGKPTLPVSLAMEKKTNVFLRAGSVAKFAEIRHLKDLE